MERGPSDYLRRFYYDTITHSDDALAYLIRLVGTDRVMLGSDYCFDMGLERPVEALQTQAGLSQDEQAEVLGGNAARLLRI